MSKTAFNLLQFCFQFQLALLQLGRDSLTDAVYARAADVVRMFASVAGAHTRSLLSST
jgi:hypothetical protein